MLLLQTRGDYATAEELFKKAIEVDPLGDIPYGPLAQIYLTQNKLEKAVEIYDCAVNHILYLDKSCKN